MRFFSTWQLCWLCRRNSGGFLQGGILLADGPKPVPGRDLIRTPVVNGASQAAAQDRPSFGFQGA